MNRGELTYGPYPERRQTYLNAVDQSLIAASESLRQRLTGERGRHQAIVRRIDNLAPRMRFMSREDIRAYAVALRPRLLHQGLSKGPVDEAFALVREVSSRTLGMRHYPVQLMGGLVLIDGGFAEMQTGEGKTIVALLPAVTAALTGIPVHVVTVNDYLAKRDSEILRPVFDAVGLTVGLVQAGQSTATRKAAYACDVTYCTNKELVFDYLRDRIAYRRGVDGWIADRGRPAAVGSESELLLRGLHFAIIDEADSVLIDEARTPLIISAEKDERSGTDHYQTALEIARQLAVDRDYRKSTEDNQIQLTPRGILRVSEHSDRLPGVWRSKRAREELVSQALTALHLFLRDRHYIITDGKVQIVDEFTGRVMADRTWERGLHQLIEIKEGCDLSHQRASLAQITYQRFFRRYVRLSGMSGTAREVAGEICAVYGLRTHRIPTNKPSRRRNRGALFLRTAVEKWQAVLAAAVREAASGRPVLIGTRSVVASEIVSTLLTQSGIDHVVLNARQDKSEAEAIAEAGKSSRITVATNMAGRGTDILLGDGVAAKGGLHVILTEFHESARIDRQFIGRAGRQGDPGSYESITSLEDDLYVRFAPRFTKWLAAMGNSCIPVRFGLALKRAAQAAAERHSGRIRRQIVRRDQDLDRAFAFAGKAD